MHPISIPFPLWLIVCFLAGWGLSDIVTTVL